MWVGFSSSAATAAFGLPVRNGSIKTRVLPSVSSKQAWPKKRMSIGAPPVGSVGVEFPRQLPADRHAHEHRDAGVLGHQRAYRADPVVGVRRGGGLEDLALVRLAEPAALVERGGQDVLELRRDPPHARLGRA